MRHLHSDYMNWAKTQSRARFNLATSGVGSFPLRQLPVSIDQLEINGDTQYGWLPLRQAIAQHSGVSPDCVVTADGASGANHLAMATLIEPGDEVLIEQPAYELLVSTALYCGASVKRLPRREENGYALDPAEVRRQITPATRLIVLTHLHNPSSVQTPSEVFREIGDLARSVNAHVLVDEIYLDAIYENTPRSVFHLGPEFIVTSSLTKVYGVSGLRCGWILAQPDVAWRMHRLNDLFSSIPVHVGNQLSVIAFENLAALRNRAKAIVDQDRALWNEFLDTHPQLVAPRTAWGTTALVRLREAKTQEETEAFISRLRTEQETSVVPGRFFDAPLHFRIGMGVNHNMFREGLARIAALLMSGQSRKFRFPPK